MSEEVITPGTTTAPPAGEATAPTPTPTLLGADPVAPEGTAPEAQTPPKADAPVGAPEKYEFKAPEGVTLDEKEMAKYEPIFREANLTNEVAQKLIDQYAADHKAKDSDAVAQIVKVHDEWLGQLKADPVIGGLNFDTTAKHAQSVIARYGTPELKQFLKESPVGSHPELVRMLATIGKAMAEDTVIVGTPTTSIGSRADVMYPSMRKS
jgi:hypothetical protein